MAEKIGSTKAEDASSEEEKRRKKRLTGFLFAGVLLLGALLPPRYKVFSPLLFLLSPLFDVLSKLHGDSIQSGSSQENRTPPHYAPPPPKSKQPYSYKPRDPKDPRKYKPIG